MTHLSRKRIHGDPNTVLHHQHGLSKTPEWISWAAMKSRCCYPRNVAYARYGGRGIKVCERWLGPDGFLNFLADMGKRPEGMSIERKNTDGDYEPNNCKWATAREQSLNRSNSIEHHHISYIEGGLKCWKLEMTFNGERVICKYFMTLEEALAKRQELEQNYL